MKDQYGNMTYAKGFTADGDQYEEDLEKEALEVAEQSDKIVVFAGLPDVFESESYDREHMRLPDCQNQLIEKLTKLGNR